MGGHENDGRHRAAFELFDDAEAVQFGHLDIEEYQVRLLFLDGFDGGEAIVAFAHDLDFGFGLEKGPEALPREWFVIYDQGANVHGFSPAFGGISAIIEFQATPFCWRARPKQSAESRETKVLQKATK
jgi:hypothetical protein